MKSYPSGGAQAHFSTTHWSLVIRARDLGQESLGAKALEELCRIYWPPIYAFARRGGVPVEDAQDATQQFFMQLIQRNVLQSVAGPDSGRFRSFLLACFRNHLTNEHRARSTKKRGGEHSFLSLDDAENNYLREPGHDLTPGKLFDKRWAETVVDRCVGLLEQEWTSQGRDFQGMKGFLTGGRGDEPMLAVAPQRWKGRFATCSGSCRHEQRGGRSRPVSSMPFSAVGARRRRVVPRLSRRRNVGWGG